MAQLSKRVMDLLEVSGTATITTQLYRRGFRSVVLSGLEPLSTTDHLVGTALTVRFAPSREDTATLDRLADPAYPQRRAIEEADPGQVVVFAGDEQGAGIVGSILLARLERRGAAGFVTGGAIRDSAEVAQLRIPVFARARNPWMHLVRLEAVDMNVIVGCCGVQIRPGDVLVGDRDGVVCVPQAVAEEVAEAASEQAALEDFIFRRVKDGARLPGTYPPDDATLAAFEAERIRPSDG